MLAKVIFLTLVAVAAAAPQNPTHKNDAEAIKNQCGGDAEVYCCNNETAEKATNPKSNLLGQCNDVTVAIFRNLVPLNRMCSQQAVCCNKTEQTGVVNIACNPIHI
ncbi:hydrophobin [Bipolaris maydis]|nr:hydrophobin [Bipolaris maydis]